MSAPSKPIQFWPESPTLKDLISLELPKLTWDLDDINYSADCDQEELNHLKIAASIAGTTINSGIEAITDILMTLEINNPGEVNPWSRINTLNLIVELTAALILLCQIHSSTT